jgi:predicted nucleic-acid-binding Zn-ribbon protein
MACRSCASEKQARFTAEINIHFPGMKNLDKPSVFVFPTVIVCLECGFTEFSVTESELRLLSDVDEA